MDAGKGEIDSPYHGADFGRELGEEVEFGNRFDRGLDRR